MWIDDQGELARQVYDSPRKLLTTKTLPRCYSAPTSELSELLGFAVQRAVENPFAPDFHIDESEFGEPGQVVPAKYLTAFQDLQTWPEFRDYMRTFADEVPIEWSWDAWLLVYVMVSEIHSARIRRFLARCLSKVRHLRDA